ncbi:hypothetical protein [Streptomyces sp. NBC_01601]|uniref:hypothetical protein n=1 Tax=Streptomyces sp. NBC_01601 TaxID=2975892 RepID=UPI002E29D1CC|nr:hypothetical protein [Streptomyces sp. NBC_01601]
MATPRDSWSLRKVATYAGVLPKIARDAAVEGVIDGKYLVETDVVLVRLYGALKRLVWPSELRPANGREILRIWEQVAVETVRAALPDKITPQTVLFVHQTGAELASSPGAMCAAMFKLCDEPYYSAPVGRWFTELPSQQPSQEPQLAAAEVPAA